jgi:23S rRNA (uracil1939-C5)-methyltransferase
MVVDAYAGIGNFAARLAGDATQVIAIELDRDAARVASSRLPEGSRAISGRVEDALADVLPTDVVILNPPRSGIEARVADLLNASQPSAKAVIYVSCNPATLARDVGRLERYRIKSLIGFDMFPQTAHVETVCELVPAA